MGRRIVPLTRPQLFFPLLMLHHFQPPPLLLHWFSIARILPLCTAHMRARRRLLRSNLKGVNPPYLKNETIPLICCRLSMQPLRKLYFKAGNYKKETIYEKYIVQRQVKNGRNLEIIDFLLFEWDVWKYSGTFFCMCYGIVALSFILWWKGMYMNATVFLFHLLTRKKHDFFSFTKMCFILTNNEQMH